MLATATCPSKPDQPQLIAFFEESILSLLHYFPSHP
jgi:hypothetical protein